MGSESQGIELEDGTGFGPTKFVSHEDIKNLPILKDGCFELIARITVNRANAKTDIEVATEKVKEEEISKVSFDFEKMMLSEEAADFKILCGGEVFTCHKAVLMTRSDFFNGAINAGMMEAESGKMAIQDHKMETMREVMHFIYTGRVKKIDEKNAQDVFIA